jgi:ribonucleoside-diphosphate reductase alpha chain
MLNNKADETFVCNLGSINLSKFIYKSGNIDWEKLRITITIAIRALDNVIDINYYPSQAASKSNLSHRPIGLGVMGYAEALNMCGIDYESEEHLDWADVLFSFIHTVAITTSANLAKEKGAYSTFEGSLWSKGILTIDTAYEGAYGITAKDYAKEYGEGYMRKIVKRGMRNCNLLAIAPTATIANIVGTSPCTELPVDSLYQKANLGGTFTVVDPCLKHNEHLAKRAHDIDQTWVIKSSAVIQKWLDQGKSTNIYRRGDIKGREVGEWYKLAHKLRLKTTYYLKNQKRQGAMKKAGEK